MKNDYSQLLIDIQKKSRITVQNVKDVKNLRDEIESGVNSNIGYNTMRRLFGFLPKTVPSFATLTLLSNYLGFTSYANYLNNKLNFDEWKKTILAVDMQNVIEQIIELKKLPTTQSTKLKIQKLQQQMDDLWRLQNGKMEFIKKQLFQ